MKPPVIGKPPSDSMKTAIIAAMPGRLLRQPGHVVNVVADDSAAAQADDDSKRAHVHQRVDEQIDHQADVSISVSGHQSQQQITGV